MSKDEGRGGKKRRAVRSYGKLAPMSSLRREGGGKGRRKCG